LISEDVTETPYFETINTNPGLLNTGKNVLLTGFGCTKTGGGGDQSGTVFRVGEAKIQALPNPAHNFIITKGKAAVCLGDSGGPAFVQPGKDGGPRIQVSVNALGNNNDVSLLASLATPAADAFFREWSGTHNVSICGLHTEATKCHAVN
jgi:hypothetical protein